MKRYLMIALLTALPMVSAAEKDIAATYTATCSVCHTSGVAGAPIKGDKAAWDARMAKGMDALVLSVDQGMNAMPPKGMCMDCTAEDFKALIEYMLK